MRVELCYLEFKNLGSYGNNLTRIDFKKGINLISAPNGKGKSFIIEALVFNFTGKPYRKLKKMKNLINRVNKKGLFTRSVFKIGKVTWKIERSMLPDKLEYFKKCPGDKDFIQQESLSSKSLDQNEIEKILKIDPFMIKQIMALDVSYNKPFLSLSAAETREILESVFNLSLFSKMLSEIKILQGEYEAELKSDIKSLEYLSNNIENQLDNINKMKILEENFNTDKEKAIQKIQLQIDEINTKLDIITENIDCANVFLEKNSKKEIAELVGLIRDLEKLNIDIRNDSKNKTDRLNLLKEGKCSKCKTVFTGDFNLELEQSKLIEDLEINKSRVDNNIEDISKYEKELNVINEINTEIQEVEYALKTEIKEQNFYNEQLVNLNNQIELEKTKTIEFNIDDLTEKYNNDVEKYENLNEKIEKSNEYIKNLKDVKNVLSDKGAKAYLMSKFIPLLNNKVAEYIERFDVNVAVTFNELMQVEITSLRNTSHIIEYESFSKGEKKRLDMAILLSFIRVTKEICNWHCNIMFLDELLDGGLDSEGLDKVGNAFKSMVKDDDLCIYAISHRKLSYDLFSNYLYVDKDKHGFSEIKNTSEGK